MTQVYVGYAVVGLVIMGGAAILIRTLKLMASGEQRPLAQVLVWIRGRATTTAFVRQVLPIILVFAFLSAITVFKSMIPKIHPFVWDAAFSDLDRLLFSTDPWRLTHAVIGSAGTVWLDRFYVTWMPVFTMVVVWQSLFAPFEQKRRFFLAFFSCWIVLGIISATIFSSAGPCFLRLLGHPYTSRYAFFPLEHAPGSKAAMDYLAAGYLKGDFGLAKGISAMPSMHVSVVTLYVLSARRSWSLALSAGYCLIIYVGSIHLGWHYAVDGIVSSVATLFIYSATKLPVGRAKPIGQRVADAS